MHLKSIVLITYFNRSGDVRSAVLTAAVQAMLTAHR
jgi:hypothetical protein